MESVELVLQRVEVGRHDPVKLRRLHLRDWHQRAEHPGVGNQHIEPAVALVDDVRQLDRRVGAGDVEGHQHRSIIALRAQGIVQRLEVIVRPGRDQNVGALGSKAQGDSAPDPPRRARDQRETSFKQAHGPFSLPLQFSFDEISPAMGSSSTPVRIGAAA